MKNQAIIIAIFVAVVAGGAGFFIGTQYQKSQTSNFGNAQFSESNGQARQGGQFRRLGQNGGALVGQITNQDDKSITVKLMDGSSKIVILSGSTSINKQATGSKDDLKTGIRIAVFGKTNSDGSVTAQNIQLNPQFRGMGNNGPTPSK